jgi:hypothetical protein
MYLAIEKLKAQYLCTIEISTIMKYLQIMGERSRQITYWYLQNFIMASLQ